MASQYLKSITYKALGLYTYPNQFGAPKGAMSTATDVFIDRPGVVESARQWLGTSALLLGNSGAGGIVYSCQEGFSATGGGADTLPTQGWYASGGTPSELKILNSAGGLGSFSTSQIFSGFSVGKYYYALLGGNMVTPNYTFSGTNGTATYKIPIDGTHTSILKRGAGMQEAPAPAMYTGTAGSGLSSLTTAAGTWGGASGAGEAAATTLANYSRAYRVLFSYTDNNNRVIRGAPSGRYIVYKPAAAFGLIIFGMDRLYAGDIVQLYASELVNNSSDPAFTGNNVNLAAAEPSDDMRLIYEYVVTQSDVTNKYITIQDIVPDVARGAALYTNDYQDGILQAEQPPPSAAFGDWFKNVAWYGGVLSRGWTQAVVNVIGLNAWAADTTKFTVRSIDYTSHATEDVTARQFQLFTGGSAAQNLFNTVRSLCRCINYNDKTCLAVFVSPPNSTQATFLIKHTGNSIGSQTLIISDISPSTITITNNAPSGSVSPAGTITTADTSKPGYLYYSKPNQPDAVPDTNYVAIGNPDITVSGIAHVRDSQFIFKADGLFRVTGTTSSNINVELFDETIRSAPAQYRTIARAGNQIFAVCSQGVVSITESGVNVISVPITDKLYNLISYNGNAEGVGSGSPILVSGCASDSEHKYFLYFKPSGEVVLPNAQLLVYNFINNSWVSLTAPSNTIVQLVTQTSNISPLNSETPDKVVAIDYAKADRPYQMEYLGKLNPKYANTSQFQYCFYDELNPASLKRFSDVKITTAGSGSISTISIQFSSDTGATPSTVQVTPQDSSICTVQVPPAHALCSQLQVLISADIGVSNLSQLMVSSVQVSYVDAGDLVSKP